MLNIFESKDVTLDTEGLCDGTSTDAINMST